MRVAIDPATGSLVAPTPEQTRALGTESGAAAGRAAPPPRLTRLADGTLKVDVGERFMNYATARIDSSGALHLGEQAMRDSVRR